MKKMLTGTDVDLESLSDTLERLANGIRDGGVRVNTVGTGHKATVEDPSAFELRLEFGLTSEYEDVTDAIEYDVQQDDGVDE